MAGFNELLNQYGIEVNELATDYAALAVEWGDDDLVGAAVQALSSYFKTSRFMKEDPTRENAVRRADAAILDGLVAKAVATKSRSTMMNDREREEKGRKAEVKQLEAETRILLDLVDTKYQGVIPASDRLKAAAFWLKLRSYLAIPASGINEETRHPFGPLATVAAGIAKTYAHGKPGLELHATACPSYLESYDWDIVGKTTGVYVYQRLKQTKLEHLTDFTGRLRPFDGGFFEQIKIHTPAPEDLKDGDFTGSFGIFHQGEAGKKSMQVHWEQMKKVETLVPGVEVVPDLDYVRRFLSQRDVDNLLQDSRVSKALVKLKQSAYIQSAYEQWGSKVDDVFGGFYLGSVVAYGNNETKFDVSSPEPLKVYLNLEEGRSPETFAGKSVGVDFRHLLAASGHHLSLLIADPKLKSPWATK